MAEIISFEEFKKRNYREILLNDIIIYPTDTIYGIGCNAEKRILVERIFEIKNRDRNKPVSVIAPSKKWILNNLEVDEKILNKYLPGPFTIVAKKKTRILDYINKKSLGVRIPDHEISKMIAKAGIPFVTTSANKSGQWPAKSVDELHGDVLMGADLVVNDGELFGKSSTIIDIRKEIRVTER